MATQKFNLTRDQLATFLKNHEQIKQFEALFQVVDEVAPASDTTGISVQAGNADATANEALAQIVRLAQDSAIDAGVADQKATQALEILGRIANALEMLIPDGVLKTAIGRPELADFEPKMSGVRAQMSGEEPSPCRTLRARQDDDEG